MKNFRKLNLKSLIELRLQGNKKNQLGHFLAQAYKTSTPISDFDEKKYTKITQKGEQSAVVIAICMQRDPQDRLEDWEELAAVAMAVQNMWLTAAQYGIGAYWGSPKAIKKVGHFLPLAEGERCLGFLFMGYVDQATRPAIRSSLSERVTWME